jgi:hypothetical protein
LCSAFSGKTSFFNLYLIQPPNEAVIAVQVRERGRKGKGESIGDNMSHNGSLGFKIWPKYREWKLD